MVSIYRAAQTWEKIGDNANNRDGEVEVGFASQKNYISLYILKQDVLDAHKEQVAGKGISFGKGCIRYFKPERIDFEIVEKMLVATEKSDAPIC